MPAQRRISFLVVCILSFYGENFGQKNTLIGVRPTYKTARLAKSFVSGPENYYCMVFGHEISRFVSKKFSKSFRVGIMGHLPEKQKENPQPFSLETLNLYFPSHSFMLYLPSYTEQLGLFCSAELQMDKLTPMPVRVRLGSLDYVNWLEQKPNSRRF